MKAQAADIDTAELYEARQAIRTAQGKAAEEQFEEIFKKKAAIDLLLNVKQEMSRLLLPSLLTFSF